MDFFMTYVCKVICGQPEPNSKEMQEMTQARLEACGIYEDSHGEHGSHLTKNSSTSNKHTNEFQTEPSGKPITTVTRNEMSRAIIRVATALCALQSEVR